MDILVSSSKLSVMYNKEAIMKIGLHACQVVATFGDSII